MITLVGWLGTREEALDAERRRALVEARVIYARGELIGTLRGLNPHARLVPFARPFLSSLEAMLAEEDPIVVVGSGDPGFFGLTRTITRQAPGRPVRVLPGPTSVQALAARLARPWDDLVVISLLGHHRARAHAELRDAIAHGRAAAVLVAPGCPLGPVVEALEPLEGIRYTLASRLWTNEEAITILEDPRSVETTAEAVLLIEPDPPANRASPFVDGWAATDGSNFTRLEVRMVALARLDPTRLAFGARVVEVGAGSGMVGLSLLSLRPDLELIALEPRLARAEMARENARRLGLPTTVRTLAIEETTGRFDAAIVGGGGADALAATLARLGPDAPVVATFADPHRAQHAADMLGNLELLTVMHVVRFGREEATSTRLEPAHPVWVAWR